METLSRKRRRPGLLRFTREGGLESARAWVKSCVFSAVSGMSGVGRLGEGSVLRVGKQMGVMSVQKGTEGRCGVKRLIEGE